MKHSTLSSNISISFGGSYRGQYEFFKNEFFVEEEKEEKGWYLQRILVHSKINFGEYFSFFGELGASNVFGKEEYSPVDKDKLYANQLFIQYAKSKWTFRIGRENMMLGSRRLVDIREGPNVRRSFDMVSLNYEKSQSNYFLFIGIPVNPKPGIFDNDFLHLNEYLWGAYYSKTVNKINYDLYYLGANYDSRTYEQETNAESRHSLGEKSGKDLLDGP